MNSNIKNKPGKKSGLLYSGIVFLVSVLLVANTVAAETDFKGKTIELIVPFQKGGGGDIWARLMAPVLPKYLPGNPEISVLNVPGGGSIKGASQFAATAQPDGLKILATSLSTQYPFLLGDSRVRYDYDDWRVLMAYRSGGVVYTTPVFGIKNAFELIKLRDKRLLFGSQGVTSHDLVPMLGFELLGLDVKPIFGMRGRGAARLAFERGEATIDFQTSAGYIKYVKPLVATGRATPLFSLGALNEKGELVRDPEFPDLPHFAEVYEKVHGKPPAGLAWESWFAFFSAGFAAQKLLVVPRETPATIVKTYQNAISQMLGDPDYIVAKEQQTGTYEQFIGARAEQLYRRATHVPEAQKRWVKDWLRKEYKVRI